MALLREYGSTLFNSKLFIELKRINEITQTEEKQIINILENLNRIGIVEYDKPTDFDSVKILETRVPLRSLKINFTSLTEMLKFEKDKLQSMVDFVFTNECRFKFILEYFGEDVKIINAVNVMFV